MRREIGYKCKYKNTLHILKQYIWTCDHSLDISKFNFIAHLWAHNLLLRVYTLLLFKSGCNHSVGARTIKDCLFETQVVNLIFTKNMFDLTCH